jgi:hypothetical protein
MFLESCERRLFLSASHSQASAATALPPKVAAVYVSSSAWSQAFKDQLATSGKGSSQFGYAIPAGSGQASVLAWSGLNQFSVRFDQAVSVVKDDLVIHGMRVPQYAIGDFSYDAASKTATWTLAAGQTFTNDQLLVEVDADGSQTLYDSGGFESPRFVPSDLEGRDAPLSGQGTWQRTGNPGVGVVENSLAASGSQAVNITRTGADERWGVQQSVPSPSSPLLVQWDMYAKQTTFPLPGSFGPYFAVEAYDGLGNAPLLAGSTGIDAATGEVLYQEAGTGYIASTGQTVAFNAWHHFDLVLDYASHKYSVYVDGSLMADAIGFVDHSAAHPINDFTDAPIAALAAAGDSQSLNATGQAYFDNYKISLAPTAVNASGLKLDGEWVNGVSQYPSGDGSAGGDFRFSVNALTADMTGDGSVNFADMVVLAQHYNQTGVVGTSQGDLTADGKVDFNDLVALAQNYNTSLPALAGASAAAAAPVSAPVLSSTLVTGKKKPNSSLFNSVQQVSPPKAVARPSSVNARH